jgi:hypothetical protein
LLLGLQFTVGKDQHAVCPCQLLLGDLQFHVLMEFQGGFPCFDDVGVGTTEGVDEEPGLVKLPLLTACGSLFS